MAPPATGAGLDHPPKGSTEVDLLISYFDFGKKALTARRRAGGRCGPGHGDRRQRGHRDRCGRPGKVLRRKAPGV
jgi:hypothetical protein